MSAALPILRLRPGGDSHLRNRHHAIFQSSVFVPPSVEDGGIVEVQAADGHFLCYATYNPRALICGRAIAFERGDPLKQLQERIRQAVALRAHFFTHEDTTCYRLVNAEGDGVPGLIVDRYGDVLVLQLTTLGMDRLRTWTTELLQAITGIHAVFEKSAGPSRKKEGLEDQEGWLTESGPAQRTVTERGLRYQIDLVGGQKTGFFLDQREMRSLVRQHAAGRTVLDVCCYVGGFSVNALAGGALHADGIDYDRNAIARAQEHVRINGLNPDNFSAYSEDAFSFLRRSPLPHRYDFIVLDPPAFAKRTPDLEPTKRAYADLNRLALEALPSGGLLLTCSCSYQMTPELFQQAVFMAARQARRSVKILSRHRQALDHPVNLFHPEGDYLKSLLLAVD
jgi:23S rRNA (cytosine1962-C5)-methyltransferase